MIPFLLSLLAIGVIGSFCSGVLAKCAWDEWKALREIDAE